jgi:hypothetical protein
MPFDKMFKTVHAAKLIRNIPKNKHLNNPIVSVNLPSNLKILRFLK